MKRENKSSGTYAVTTYGCQMNAHDSEKIAGVLERIGLTRSDSAEPLPDVLVLNTCCIRDSAEQRIIGHIGTLKKKKSENPDLIIAVTGCLTEQSGAAERIAATFPFVDIILGTSDIEKLGQEVARRLHTSERISDADFDAGAVRAPAPSAYVNVMYGCDNFCSYCIVPYVRGRERSRPAEDIIQEVSALCRQGYREITLLGQNVNSYGGGGDRFAQLIRRIADSTPVERIRFMTSHPKDMSDALIATVREVPVVCSHVHLPVQSGSDRILQSMNRGYTSDEYLRLVDRLRSEVPGVVLTTDVIVGYPGETEADFEDTLSLMNRVKFDAAYTFVYSPRSGTVAAGLPDQVPKALKKTRITRLVNFQNSIVRRINEESIGCRRRLLVEGKSARGETMCGRTEGGKMVNFEGDESLRGAFVDVLITEARGSTLFGVLEGIA